MPWQRSNQNPDGRIRLEGRLVILRSKVPEDAPVDYSWRADPELAALDATAPINLSLEDYIRLYRDDLAYPGPWSRRLAIETHDGRHIGNCMYYDIDRGKKQAEFGIMIGDRSCWSKGYGTDAVLTALRHVFTTTDLERIYLHTLTHNKRAQRAFQKAGFQPVGPVSRDGFHFVRMEVWRDDWVREHGNDSDSEAAVEELEN